MEKKFSIYITLVAILTSCKCGIVHETVYEYNGHSPYMYHTLYSPFGPSKMGEQKNAVRDLEKMISNHPAEQKYRDVLEEYKNKLYKEYRERVEDRMVFL